MKATMTLDEMTYPVTNIYRTKNYTVYQKVQICYGNNGAVLYSEDVFRLRTPERDQEYDKAFGPEDAFNKRKRMKVAASTRTYC